MSLILKMQAELKTAWHLVQAETDIHMKQEALYAYKKKLAQYLRQKLFISTVENSDPL